ncbi:major facilitator superfamily domain-containing protein [Triangularia verruculosa]|uniref:Major facilitator superfamily domain-containing protein n=1 Tax=Triangularia verruculosa TaxID=2587418 RepID=A0AAN7APS2_9PEZI|nr:major facilitator superfamily domain-containing protein [Triangularia verruculosa]
MAALSLVVKGEDPDAGLSAAERAAVERKLVRHLDLTLLPWLCFLYLLAFLDRTNIGNAKIDNMTKQVVMSNMGYSATLMIFFVAYASFEAVANVLLKRMRPSIFLPLIMIGWGTCMTAMGFVQNWSGLMAARFFLGVFESGLYPGVNYFISCWYRRDEFALRAALFFSFAALAGSFGGLLAAAISKMDGIGGLAGWRWIFILEGAFTILVAFASFWMVHDFPDTAKFLSEADRARVLFRLTQDKQSSAHHEEFKMLYVWQALKDKKTYLAMIVFMGPIMPLYSISLFLPTIISNLSFTDPSQVIKNQLLSVPPYAAAALVTILVGVFSDRYHKRGIYNMGLACIGILGFILLAASSNAIVQYMGSFFGTIGVYASIPLTIAWVANNTEGSYKRGIVLGLVIGWGNLNGLVSCNLWFGAPRFLIGHITVIGYLALFLGLGSYVLRRHLSSQNRDRQQGLLNDRLTGLTEEEIGDLGDANPDFMYIL